MSPSLRPSRVLPGHSTSGRRVVFPIGLIAFMLLVNACTSTGVNASSEPMPPAACGSSDTVRVVVLVSGTASEPRPSLTPRAWGTMRGFAELPVPEDGTGSAALVTSADGLTRRLLPLTPRRQNCEVEHGLQRARLVGENVDRVATTMSGITATGQGLDLLRAMDDAVRGPPGVLIVTSSGLSTAGGFDLRKVGWQLEPQELVRQLNEQRLLTDMLAGWRVLLTGIGQTAGRQPPLTKPARDTLIDYICAIVVAAGGRCDVDANQLDAVAPVATTVMPIVDVPGIVSAVGPDGLTTMTLSDAVLGFAGDSATLSPQAHSTLQDIAAHMTSRPRTGSESTVIVRGYVADPPSSTAEGRRRLSEERAVAVARFLAAELARSGHSLRIDAAGIRTPPGMTAIVNGSFDEVTATRMRIVTVSY